ncbi:AAA family ATPase [Streptomyces sanglieri]|uniref:AAA family ATPase n=1 Tax=Streptomyces sanglieri TaxID=193460 RepID=UPI0035246EBA
MSILFLTCGLPGSGKTTLARRLEREWSALRLTADEWLHELHPNLSGDELDAMRDPVERVQWSVAVRVLETGGNVVLDWGVWAREERDLPDRGTGSGRPGRAVRARSATGRTAASAV